MAAPGGHVSGLPVAVDAMGGDKAPGEIVAGARQARDTLGVPVVLVGSSEKIGDTLDLPVIEASEVIEMDDDPGPAVRRKKDSSLVRAAEAVRDGKASAMVSAGNTGAAMASALLRMGRLKGIARPGIATPIPRVGTYPSILIDAGANAECTSAMLVQFAQMGAAYASARYHTDSPSVALLSIGEEPTKGNALVKETHAALAQLPGINFVGNVEGRDLLPGTADVVVTDGFTGNVALKALEGSLKFFMGALLGGLLDRRGHQASVRSAHASPRPARRGPGSRRDRGSCAARGERGMRHKPRIVQCQGHRLGCPCGSRSRLGRSRRKAPGVGGSSVKIAAG